MSETLHRLVYYSRTTLPGTPEDMAGDIDEILAASQRNNARVGVTGALMFNRGCFAQVLEGSRDAVEQTFERIQRDPRHGDVTVLEFAPADTRGFASWSMTFVGRARDDLDLFAHIGRDSGFEPGRVRGERIFQVMRDLMLDEETAAG